MKLHELYEEIQNTERCIKIVEEAVKGLKEANKPLHVQSIEILKGNEGTPVENLWYKAHKCVNQAIQLLEGRLAELRIELSTLMHSEVKLEMEDRNIKVIEGELKHEWGREGFYDTLNGESGFIGNSIGLTSGSVKVRITVKNLED